MPRSETVLVVFVASPSDLEEERTRLEEVVKEMNLTWSRTFQLRLDLVRWETHGYPGFGKDAQDVLNRELPDDHDIFIGLLWGKYGTPTGRAGSGTEEEFNRALEHHREHPDATKIMFYFKDAPLSPSAIDPDQLRRVQRFRAELGEKGGLYWDFRSLADFERLIRLHLARQIQELVGDGSATAFALPDDATADGVTETRPNGEDVDFGLIDYLDLVDDHFGSLKETMDRLSNETRIIGDKMKQRTQETNEAMAKAKGKLSRKEAKHLVEKAAEDLDNYAVRIRPELPILDESLRRGAEAAGKAVLISLRLKPQDKDELLKAKSELETVRDAIVGALDSLVSFRMSIRDLPRLTAALNKSKREVAAVLQQFIDSLTSGRDVTTEAIRALEGGGDGATMSTHT